MNEKQFVYEEEPYHFPIKKRIRDTQNNETYVYDLRECCELLNEQQDIIHTLKEEVRLFKPTNIEQYEQIVRLQEENEQLQKENEQLRKELDNFKPVMFQDMRKGTVILYSKEFGNNDKVLNAREAIIQILKLENENLRKQVKPLKTTLDATSNYNAHLESKITTLEKENEQLREIVNKLEEAIGKKEHDDISEFR